MEKKKNSETSAFPLNSFENGLTKMEYFTAQAMKGFLANPLWKDAKYSDMAIASTTMAKVMLKELDK